MDKDKAIKESQMKAAINAKLVETGERERCVIDYIHTRINSIRIIYCFFLNMIYRLKELLQQKLIECGWRDQVKAYCKGKYGFMNV